MKSIIQKRKLRFRFLFSSFAFLLFTFTFFCYANDIQIEATVDRDKTALGEAIQLNLAVYGTQNVPAPELNNKIDNFDVRYLGPSTMISIVNGATTSSITHLYTLIPLKTGIFTIGPLSVDVNGKTLTSKPITIEVLPASSINQQSTTSHQSSSESTLPKINEETLKDRIFLILNIDKQKIYLNELTPLVIKLYVNSLGIRDIQLPTLETNNFSIDKFNEPKQYREELGGILYDVIEFTTNIFAIKSGELSLGPAKLKCNLIIRRQTQRRQNRNGNDLFSSFFNDDVFDDFFGRYEAYPLDLKSASVPITILPLPEENKPNSFDGALGNFNLDVTATPLQVKAGDPITLKMTIKGKGNLDSVKTPKLQSIDGFKVYDPQIKQTDTEKIFEQVLIPESEKIANIPQVNFSFFNTQTGQYQTLTNNAIPIIVTKPEDSPTKLLDSPQNTAQLIPKEELGRDIIYIKNSLGKLKNKGHYLYQNFIFWFINFTIFIIFIGVIIFRLEQQKLITDTRYARRLHAPTKAKKGIKEVGRLLNEGKNEAFFDAVFKTIRIYLADRFHLSTGGITQTTIEEITKTKNISNNILEKIKKIFTACDMARYAPAQFSQKQLEDIFQDLKEIIDYLEKQKV